MWVPRVTWVIRMPDQGLIRVKKLREKSKHMREQTNTKRVRTVRKRVAVKDAIFVIGHMQDRRIILQLRTIALISSVATHTQKNIVKIRYK